MSDSSQPDSSVQSPPVTLGGTLKRLGPGLIIAGSIVGSGELIATTRVGAEAGFYLLWLIIIGCAIKVFCQVELGRHTLTHGETPLDAMNKVPGPRFKVNWLVWAWAIMTLTIVTQQGGIMGGVGQALSISAPLTEQGQLYNALDEEKTQLIIERAVKIQKDPLFDTTIIDDRLNEIEAELNTVGQPNDTFIWVFIIGITTSVILYFGKYGLIQAVSTIFVSLFSLVTLVTLFLLQNNPDYAIQGSELAQGVSFNLPKDDAGNWFGPLATALMAFGIIGVGGSELIMYPYWCLEKGYAKFTGKRDNTEEWARRAKGWMRVMRVDAWLSMVVYTFATVAFYLLGAAVLNRTGLNPTGESMIRTLSQMYVPVFGAHADTIFLVGAFAVLYSTLFVAGAGNARMVADGLGLFGVLKRDEDSRLIWSRRIASLWILMATFLYIFLGYILQRQSPSAMVLASGLAQAIMLPLLGIAILYFRFKRIYKDLKPGKLWDVMLLISVAGFVIAGIVAIVVSINKFT